jgi:hypothetical protein
MTEILALTSDEQQQAMPYYRSACRCLFVFVTQNNRTDSRPFPCVCRARPVELELAALHRICCGLQRYLRYFERRGDGVDFPEPTKVSPYFHIAVVLVVFFGGLRNLVYKSTPPSITTFTMSDTTNDNPNDANNADKSDFLQSMTFATTTAQQHLRACDCDECDAVQVPLSMVQYIRERKRQRLENVPVKRTQHRELICRHPASSVAVYRYTMPLDAAPLVEFGTSHRLVWMQRLPPKTSSTYCNVISSIGKGIIGSSDEENSRRPLPNWIEGKVFLVPSNGGKAVGWIYHHDTQQKVKEDAKSQQQQNGMTDKDEDAVIQRNSSPNGIGGGPAVMIVEYTIKLYDCRSIQGSWCCYCCLID